MVMDCRYFLNYPDLQLSAYTAEHWGLGLGLAADVSQAEKEPCSGSLIREP